MLPSEDEIRSVEGPDARKGGPEGTALLRSSLYLLCGTCVYLPRRLYGYGVYQMGDV